MMLKIESMRDLIFNRMHEEVLIIAEDFKILDVNNTLLQKTGMKQDQVVGQYCYEITHHSDIPCRGAEHLCPLVEILKSGKQFHTTHTHLDNNGRKLYYSISSYPIFENEKILGIVEMSRDITQEINYQKMMMHNEKLISLGRLSAGVAHEINNPLTAILTTTKLLQEDIGPQNPLYQELDIIYRETIRCRNIVLSLLDFARQSIPHKAGWNINDIVSESVLLTEKQAILNNVELSILLDKSMPTILVDKDQIQQAFINLIINAIEAASTKTGTAREGRV